MRSENIQAWAESVEFGHPPPSQPPFDEHGNAELFYHDGKAYPYPIGMRVAEIAALKRFSQQQKILLRNAELKDLEIPNTSKAGPPRPDAEAYLNQQRKILFQNGGAKDLKPAQKPGPGLLNQDREAYMNQIRKRQAEIAKHERMARQRKIPFPNRVPEDPKPETGPYTILSRKLVPNSNATTPQSPQMVRLRNGETRRIGNIPSYAEHVRERGYPEGLCPLAVKKFGAENVRGVDCTGVKVVKEKENRGVIQQNGKTNKPGRSDGTHRLQTPFLAPEPPLSSRETRALALRPAPTAIPNPMCEATIRDVVDMGLVTSSTRS